MSNLPYATMFRIKVKGTQSLSAVTAGRPGKGVHINMICLVATKHPQPSCPLYYLQAIRSGARKNGSVLCEAEYKQIEKYAAELLAKGLRECAFDAVVAAPTSRRVLQEPFLQAIQSLKTGVPDLTSDLTLTDPAVKSDSPHTMDERIANLKWSAGRDWTALKHILIVDDVVGQGRTAVPLIHSIRDLCLTTHEPVFTLCAPLWIIRDDAKSWLTPS